MLPLSSLAVLAAENAIEIMLFTFFYPSNNSEWVFIIGGAFSGRKFVLDSQNGREAHYTFSKLQWFAIENQQSLVYVVNHRFSRRPDRC